MPTLEQIMESGIVTKTSSAVNREFVPFSEQLTAQYMANQINSGILSVQDAWQQMFSYEEDAQLWNLPNGQWRGVLPAWKNILSAMSAELTQKPLNELIELIANGHFLAKPTFLQTEGITYDPFFQDFIFAVDIVAANSDRVNNSSLIKLVSEAARLADVKDPKYPYDKSEAGNSRLREPAMKAYSQFITPQQFIEYLRKYEQSVLSPYFGSEDISIMHFIESLNVPNLEQLLQIELTKKAIAPKAILRYMEAKKIKCPEQILVELLTTMDTSHRYDILHYLHQNQEKYDLTKITPTILRVLTEEIKQTLGYSDRYGLMLDGLALLGTNKYLPAAPFIRTLLTSKEKIPEYAIDALIKIQPESIGPLLEQLLMAPDTSKYAIEKMIQLKYPLRTEKLRQLILSGNPDHVLSLSGPAIELAVVLKREEVYPDITRVALHRFSKVLGYPYSAITALAAIGNTDALEQILSLNDEQTNISLGLALKSNKETQEKMLANPKICEKVRAVVDYIKKSENESSNRLQKYYETYEGKSLSAQIGQVFEQKTPREAIEAAKQYLNYGSEEIYTEAHDDCPAFIHDITAQTYSSITEAHQKLKPRGYYPPVKKLCQH